MTSSMLSGERRWASSKRGGMTVLGKVAVPKPINLPSQRLENHGLDPNVEIVPKGTLSWGSRTSSSSNAWGSSSLSPNTDGGLSSPSCLSARPSSGGSGMRPSTAGSDRALEPTSNAWGSNSRPSSASGALTSNQTSLASLRPRSAETRPGSSQLSRLNENSVAWSAARTSEKLGITQEKNDEFSLSSGDFPTLGSEKDKSVKNSELQDHSSHGRPGSSSGLGKVKTEALVVDDAPVNANVKDGTLSSWRRERDSPAYSEDGVGAGTEKWQGNPQPYPNAAFPPQHYDAWHGPPVNKPQGGVWFRGPPGGPPFVNPVAPGGFPIEPFSYCRPHIPPTGLANPPPIPSPGPGPRGHHPKNGDLYRPPMPDAYIHPGPGMPVRPGFYSGPMSYDGYYGPPMGYYNSSERDVPYMGMAAGPSVYNRYSNQNPPEPGNPQGRSGGYGSAEKPSALEQVESSHSLDTGGPYRVLLKQHNERDGRNDPPNWEDSETANASYVDRRNQPRMSVWENVQRSDYRKNEEVNLRTSACSEEVSSQTLENQGSSSSMLVKTKSRENVGNVNTSGDISARKLDAHGAAFSVQEVPLRQSTPKDSSLIRKIEGLNAKVRDNSSAKSREEQRNKFHAGSAPVNHVKNEDGVGAVFTDTTNTEVINALPCELGVVGVEKNLESLSFHGTPASRQTAHGMQGRTDHRNKGRSNTQDADGWQKKSVVADSSISSGAQLEASIVHVGDHRISVETYKRFGSLHQARHDEESVQTMFDPSDSQAQRAKIKELPKQRTKQLQEEEEERTRMQKAKAPAKLEELNRRTQATEGFAQKENAISPTLLQNKHVELQRYESTTESGKSGAVNSATMCNADVFCQISETSINKVEKSPILSNEPALETQKNAGKEPVLSHSKSLSQDVNSADAINSIQVHNNVASKTKRMGSKQKQNFLLEKTSNEKLVSTTPFAPKVENDTMVHVTLSSGIAKNEIGTTSGSELPINLAAMTESSVNQKKKNNRNGKNKHKVEETSSLAALPMATPREANLSKSSVESDKPKASNFELDQDSVQPTSLSNDPNQYSEQRRYLPNEESHGRMNNQWKSQHSRKTPRNVQSNRPAEKSHGNDAVIWAPVKPQNKIEIMDESSDKSKIEAVHPVKGDQQVHNNLKNKRAEIERYIPKPVAKEMAQQGSIQQVASSTNEAPTDEFVGRADSGCTQTTRNTSSSVGKVGSGTDSKNGDGRQAKQGKAHGSWRQRGSTESTNVHAMQDGLNCDPNSDQSVCVSTEHQQTQKSEMSSVKGQTKHVSDSTEPDGSNNPNNQDLAARVSIPAIKDQTATGRARRGPFRGHKGWGPNHDIDHKKYGGEAEKIESLISSSEPGQPDVGAAFKEIRVVGERLTSHWQPKSQASINQRGNIPNDQNVGSEVSQVNKKDSTSHGGVSHSAGRDKETKMQVSQSHHDQSVSEKSKAGEAPNIGNQEAKRDRRNAPPKGRSHSPNQVTVSSVELAPTSMDPRHEQRPSSGFRKNGNQNRFGRGHESRGDWISAGQDNKHYNQPPHRERQGQNMQYEYHPVGPYDNSKSDNSERPKDGNHNGGRFRERGQSHSRRGGGNFYGRQGGGFD